MRPENRALVRRIEARGERMRRAAVRAAREAGGSQDVEPRVPVPLDDLDGHGYAPDTDGKEPPDVL